MATAPTADSLSKEERSLVVAALVMKRASIIRATKAETNAEVVKIRAKEVDEVNNLINKFS